MLDVSGVEEAVTQMVSLTRLFKQDDPALEAAALLAIRTYVRTGYSQLPSVLTNLYAEGYRRGAGLTAGLAAGATASWLNRIPGVHIDTNDARDALRHATGALAILFDNTATVINGLKETTIRRLAKKLAELAVLGWSADRIVDELNKIVADVARAGTIAVTEAAKTVAAAATDTMTHNRVEAWNWVTNSGNPCPTCIAYAAGGPYPVLGGPALPDHPNCFPAGTVVEGPHVIGSVQRWWEGELVELVVGESTILAGTPNHPILTPHGWVALGDLSEGDEVIRYVGSDDVALVGEVDDHQMPALIEDVAETLGGARSVATVEVPTAAPDFHGDGVEGQIAVIRSELLLGDDGDAAFGEQVEKGLLGGAVGGTDPFVSSGTSEQSLDGVLLPSAGGVGSGDVSGSLLGSVASQELGFGTAAQGDTGLNESHSDRGAGDTESFGQCEHRLAIDVPVDELISEFVVAGRAVVLEVRRVPFAGHVFNLQTVRGWYAANSIISHNCQCTAEPVMAQPQDIVMGEG